jgi:hypothetical protein
LNIPGSPFVFRTGCLRMERRRTIGAGESTF